MCPEPDHTSLSVSFLMCPEPDHMTHAHTHMHMHMYMYMSLSSQYVMLCYVMLSHVSVGLVVFSHLSLLLLRTPLT